MKITTKVRESTAAVIAALEAERLLVDYSIENGEVILDVTNIGKALRVIHEAEKRYIDVCIS